MNYSELLLISEDIVNIITIIQSVDQYESVIFSYQYNWILEN